MTEAVTPTHFMVTYRHGRDYSTVMVKADSIEEAKAACVTDYQFAIQSAYPVPLVGMPATIHYVTDSSAAVVVKVNPKSVLIARVAVGERKQDMRVDGATDPNCPPVMVAEGITDQIIGEPHRYQRLPNGRIADGSISATLGYSVSRTDYRA